MLGACSLRLCLELAAVRGCRLLALGPRHVAEILNETSGLHPSRDLMVRDLPSPRGRAAGLRAARATLDLGQVQQALGRIARDRTAMDADQLANLVGRKSGLYAELDDRQQLFLAAGLSLSHQRDPA